MLRVAEPVSRTDTGRQRSANEDSFLVSPPLFAVADGMGGAQAGEVASRIAAEAFAGAERGDESPEAYLRRVAEAANERIHRLAQSDAARSGMGTTLTAAILDGEREEVSLAHVGDSRAYLFRDGQLKLLTSDHSLVEELRRQGRLTAEAAEDHPQRSIITRALGPDPAVEVDTMTYRARPGDVYLLCSDGLTTMLKESEIAAVLASAPRLADAVDRLVRAANDAGGRDNITVVAFRVEEAAEPQHEAEGKTLVGPTAAEAGLEAEPLRARAPRPGRPVLGGAASRERARRRGRTAAKAALAAVLVAAVIAGAVVGARQIYFLGGDSAGRLSLYRGLPYELPLGIDLYSKVYSAPVQISSIPAGRRDEAVDHTLRSHDDAVDLLQSLEASATPPRRAVPAQGGGRPAGGRERAGSRSRG